MDGWVGEWKDGRMNGWHESIDGWMKGGRDRRMEWIGVWMDEWMDGWIECIGRMNR